MSLEVLIWIALAVLLVMGTPIFVSLGMASITVLLLSDIPLSLVMIDLIKVSDMFPLLAVVGFVFAGALMERGGMAAQIVEVASMLVGHIRGGLGIVTILGCMFFASMIGSGPGTVAAMGSIMIPTMVRRGYSPEYAAGVCATGGTLGILIPPSNPMIIYGVVANTSILGLFKAIWDGKWALATPVLILGGIYCGVFTPTEAAEVGVVWTLFVGLFVYRKLSWQNISSALIRTSAFAGSATVLVGVSMAFSRLLTLYHIPQSVGAFLASISTDPSITLLLIAFFIFLCGFVADTLAMVVVLAPVFLPITNSLGIHPIQLGVLFVVCCETGFLTPPFGANLFITMKITDIKLEQVAARAFPYLCTIWLLLFVIAVWPDFVMFLPRLLM